MQKSGFNHEKLEVYQRSLKFITWLTEVIDILNKGNRNIINQIDRASISVVLNIAEGNGKHSSKEHKRYIEIAKSSALECAAALDVMFAKKIINEQKLEDGKEMAVVIVKMLYKLGESL